MRRGFYILFVMFVLNASAMYVNGLTMFSNNQNIDVVNTTQLTDAWNSTSFVQNWDPSESGGLFGDLRYMLQNVMRLGEFITAFPNIWRSMYLPDALVDLFNVVWLFMWGLVILDVIGGRIFGD